MVANNLKKWNLPKYSNTIKHLSLALSAIINSHSFLNFFNQHYNKQTLSNIEYSTPSKTTLLHYLRKFFEKFEKFFIFNKEEGEKEIYFYCNHQIIIFFQFFN